MARGSTWVNADGLRVGSGTNTASPVSLTDERAIDGELRHTIQQQIDLISPGNLSSVTYDSSGRAIAWNIDSVGYVATYSGTSIVVESTDGLRRVISLDTQGRYASSVSEA